MLGSFAIVVGIVFGVVSLLITGSFGGDKEELVAETINSGEAVEVVVEDNGEAVVTITELQEEEHEPTSSVVVKKEEIVVESNDDYGDSSIVYESEDGTTRVETNIDEGSVQVKVRQSVTSSGSVKSKTHIKVSTE